MMLSQVSKTLLRRRLPYNSSSFSNRDFEPFSSSLQRFLSTGSSGGDGDDTNNKQEENSDPFGMSYEDGENNVGPKSKLPPVYSRDPVSGKLTGEIERDAEQDEANSRLLNMTNEEREEDLSKSLLESWKSLQNKDSEEEDESLDDEISRMIRRQEIALNPHGRKVSDVSEVRELMKQRQEFDEESGEYEDDDSMKAPLSSGEFKSFKNFMKKTQNKSVGSEDIPIMSNYAPPTSKGFDPDQDLSWITDANASSSQDWLENIMPSDLEFPRRVNRRDAKPIPKELLHHNNLALLRRYVTPGGQIVNRTQSRLGAKDQRKVAKLIKRARHLGLIPVIGKWKYEDHGDLFADDLDQDREWEKELKNRGLWIQRIASKAADEKAAANKINDVENVSSSVGQEAKN